MAKWQNDLMLDAALNWLKSDATYAATKLHVCSSQPTTYAEANATYMLAQVAIDSSDFTGPANGDTNGRKISINEQADISVTNSGTAEHIALTNADTLLYVTTCTSQALTSGNTVTVPAWDIEIADAS